MKKLLYFGCVKEKGHYLWISEAMNCHNVSTLRRYAGIHNITDRFIYSIDGSFQPFDNKQGAYKESFVPPFRIVAWNDYTLDSRPGSNSALLGIGYASADEMIDDAINHFPSVMKRQTSPLHPVSESYL